MIHVLLAYLSVNYPKLQTDGVDNKLSRLVWLLMEKNWRMGVDLPISVCKVYFRL